jgi:hypothetical protein
MSNPPNAQQLLLVKELFGEAQTLTLRDDTFSTSKAILFLDLSVEQMMRAVIFTLNPTINPRKDLNWQELWTAATAGLQRNNLQLHNYFSIKTLHEHRNMVQHTGAAYQSSQARMHVAPVEDMLSHAFLDVYGLQFSRYSLRALIKNGDLRQWLEDAAQLLSDGKPILTIAACNYAHSLVIEELQNRTGFRSATWSRRLSPRELDLDHLATLTEAIISLDERLTDALEVLEDEVAAIGVGLSILEVRRFRVEGDVVTVSVFADGQMDININYDKALQAQQASAEFMLGYITRLIRSIEETYGSVLQKLEIEVPLMQQGVVKDREVQSENNING